MKKGPLLLLAFVLASTSLVLLLHGTTKGTSWPLLVMILLPAATWIVAKANIKTYD